MIMSSIIFIGYFIRKYWYLPYNFKKVHYQEYRTNPQYAQVSDNNIKLCVDCLYDGFHHFHGPASNFPQKNDYDDYDIIVLYTCEAGFLYDKEKSEFYLTHLDSLVNDYFINRH